MFMTLNMLLRIFCRICLTIKNEINNYNMMKQTVYKTLVKVDDKGITLVKCTYDNYINYNCIYILIR